MEQPAQFHHHARGVFWTSSLFYLLIAFEFFYMATPFAVYFYSIYKPALHFFAQSQLLSPLGRFFLPHIVVNTASPLLNHKELIGLILAAAGSLCFMVAAGQVYYNKITKKGVVSGGLYRVIRHPQYASLIVAGLGLLLLWPRTIALVSYVTMIYLYALLARIEEIECKERFGDEYQNYRRRTAMFLPLPRIYTSLSMKLSRSVKYGLVIVLYLASISVSIIAARQLEHWSAAQLYVLFSERTLTISAMAMEQGEIDRIAKTVFGNPGVQMKIKEIRNADSLLFVNYVLPSDFWASEIPMVRNGHDGYRPFLSDSLSDTCKVIVTTATMRHRAPTSAIDFILNIEERIPRWEVHLSRHRSSVLSVVPINNDSEGLTASAPIF